MTAQKDEPMEVTKIAPLVIPNNEPSTSGRIVTGAFVDHVVSSLKQPLVLDDDVKRSLILYTERLVDQVAKETVNATKLRDGKKIENRDVTFALRTKFNIEFLS